MTDVTPTTETSKAKRQRLPADQRDQSTLELQVMNKCRNWLNQLRSHKARLRVANFLLQTAEDDKTDRPAPPNPRQDDLPHTDPASAVPPGQASKVGTDQDPLG